MEYGTYLDAKITPIGARSRFEWP